MTDTKVENCLEEGVSDTLCNAKDVESYFAELIRLSQQPGTPLPDNIKTYEEFYAWIKGDLK
jgi:hypothetical protein